MNLKGKDFLNLEDFSKQELTDLIELAYEFKVKLQQGESLNICKNKTLLIYFEKPSLRTRLSFETGIVKLGGTPLFITKSEFEPDKRESIDDAARVMAKYTDAMAIRTFEHETLEKFAKWSNVPIINALSDKSHPCQIMADILTIKEHFGNLENKKLAYIGDANNVSNSLLIGCSILGINISIATPVGYEPNEEIVKLAMGFAKESKVNVEIYTEPKDAIQNADIIYTDTWVSMGQEKEAEIKKKAFQGYQVNDLLCIYANKNHIVMHCLPAHKGEEIDYYTFEKHQEILFNQAHNRCFAQMAIMASIM